MIINLNQISFFSKRAQEHTRFWLLIDIKTIQDAEKHIDLINNSDIEIIHGTEDLDAQARVNDHLQNMQEMVSENVELKTFPPGEAMILTKKIFYRVKCSSKSYYKT